MSPKSRGRPAGRGRPKRRAQTPRQLEPADRLLHAARELLTFDEPLAPEVWASEWLGRAWANADLADREPEQSLCVDVSRRVAARPGPHGVAALTALSRVAPPQCRSMLAEALDGVGEPPVWAGATQWRATTAARAETPWGDERLLFVEYDGPRPHGLVATVHDTGGRMVRSLSVTEPGAATLFASMSPEPGEPPMPVTDAAPVDILRELADALRDTDMYWPRSDDEGFVAFRALAWSRARPYLAEPAEWEPISDHARRALIEEFVAEADSAGDDVSRSLADLFVDYGDGYMPGDLLAWSPGWAALFLTDYLPRKVALDAEQRAGLGDVLRAWVRFALRRRGVASEWVQPVIEAIDECLPEFAEAFDDEQAWGPAKQVVAALQDRGIDLTDKEEVERAVSALNAEALARRLRES